MSQPSFYKVVDTQVASMTEEAIRKEVNDLKREIVTIETRMGEKAAWAKDIKVKPMKLQSKRRREPMQRR